MKKFNIYVDKPRLLDSSDIKHTATSWVIRSTPDATSKTNIIHHSFANTVNLYNYEVNLDVDNDATIYVATKFHFGNGIESKWSNLVSVKAEQKGYKLSDVVVGTPIVGYDYKNDSDKVNKVRLFTSKINVISGFGKHKSTSWLITDSDGKILWKRIEDEDNLTEIYLDLDQFDLGKTFIIYAKHHTDTNGNSRFGKYVFGDGDGRFDLYDIILLTPPIINRTLYAEVILRTTRFQDADLKLCNKYGEIVIEAYDQPTIRPTMFISATEEGVVTKQTTLYPYITPQQQTVKINDPLDYRYIVVPEGSHVRWEANDKRLVDISGPAYIASRDTDTKTPELLAGNYGDLYFLVPETKQPAKLENLNDLETYAIDNMSGASATVGEEITIWGRVKLDDGTIGAWKLLYEGPLLQAYIVDVDREHEYLGKYSYAGEINMNGYTMQNIRECGNDIVLYNKYKDNNVLIAKIWQNRILELGHAFPLPEEFDVTISYLNIIPTYTDDLFINYMATANKIGYLPQDPLTPMDMVGSHSPTRDVLDYPKQLVDLFTGKKVLVNLTPFYKKETTSGEDSYAFHIFEPTNPEYKPGHKVLMEILYHPVLNPKKLYREAFIIDEEGYKLDLYGNRTIHNMNKRFEVIIDSTPVTKTEEEVVILPGSEQELAKKYNNINRYLRDEILNPLFTRINDARSISVNLRDDGTSEIPEIWETAANLVKEGLSNFTYDTELLNNELPEILEAGNLEDMTKGFVPLVNTLYLIAAQLVETVLHKHNFGRYTDDIRAKLATYLTPAKNFFYLEQLEEDSVIVSGSTELNNKLRPFIENILPLPVNSLDERDMVKIANYFEKFVEKLDLLEDALDFLYACTIDYDLNPAAALETKLNLYVANESDFITGIEKLNIDNKIKDHLQTVMRININAIRINSPIIHDDLADIENMNSQLEKAERYLAVYKQYQQVVDEYYMLCKDVETGYIYYNPFIYYGRAHHIGWPSIFNRDDLLTEVGGTIPKGICCVYSLDLDPDKWYTIKTAQITFMN